TGALKRRHCGNLYRTDKMKVQLTTVFLALGVGVSHAQMQTPFQDQPWRDQMDRCSSQRRAAPSNNPIPDNILTKYCACTGPAPDLRLAERLNIAPPETADHPAEQKPERQERRGRSERPREPLLRDLPRHDRGRGKLGVD